MCRFRLKGLDPDKTYCLQYNGEVYKGYELLYFGLSLPHLEGDFRSFLVVLEEI
ncbi:GH36 C-terminal domain-containing protein [Paenibacillus sp. B2(2019)]|uniref:GH36 C-terminal domain-containing protein n=1 Tax=Paenibacillus sp. B2(2019) TaxID=2607754 RepID=UPI003977BB84